jgi:hypothetical protein
MDPDYLTDMAKTYRAVTGEDLPDDFDPTPTVRDAKRDMRQWVGFWENREDFWETVEYAERETNKNAPGSWAYFRAVMANRLSKTPEGWEQDERFAHLKGEHT